MLDNSKFSQINQLARSQLRLHEMFYPPNSVLWQLAEQTRVLYDRFAKLQLMLDPIPRYQALAKNIQFENNYLRVLARQYETFDQLQPMLTVFFFGV